MQATSYRASKKKAARFKRRMAEQAVEKQVAAYNKLVAAGIGLVKYWALAATIIPDHIKVLSALLSFVDSSYYSDKPQKAKTDAVGLALRAAYLYGKFNGRWTRSPYLCLDWCAGNHRTQIFTRTVWLPYPRYYTEGNH